MAHTDEVIEKLNAIEGITVSEELEDILDEFMNAYPDQDTEDVVANILSFIVVASTYKKRLNP